MSNPGFEDDLATERAVLAANDAFYRAFEARDLRAMSDVWERSERATCTHPGWRRLHGWPLVMESWRRLFEGPQRLQFVLTDVSVVRVADVAIVHLDENLLDAAATGTVAALNVFVSGAQGWRMLAHHGSPVAR